MSLKNITYVYLYIRKHIRLKKILENKIIVFDKTVILCVPQKLLSFKLFTNFAEGVYR